MHPHEVHIKVGSITLFGSLLVHEAMRGIVIFSHGSGSSRHSPRNQMVASYLQKQGFGTLLFDLLTPEEDEFRENRFNIDLLAQRLIAVGKWMHHQPGMAEFPIAFFGASTGAASALKAAAQWPHVAAVISRGGRPDLAMEDLPLVTAPTLFIVGSLDDTVLELNKAAMQKMQCLRQLCIVEGATHLFEENGKMLDVCRHAAEWLLEYCVPTEVS